MAYISIKKPLGTPELELVLYKGEYTVNICAYGEWWEEVFKSLEDAEQYLTSTWHFTPSQIKEIKDNMEVIP